MQNAAVQKIFTNPCKKATGIAVDDKRGALFVACAEGQVISIITATGNIVATVTPGAGIDAIAFSPSVANLYVPAHDVKKLVIYHVNADATLTRIGDRPIGSKSHCVAVDDHGIVAVCDPERGGVYFYRDI